MLIFMLKKAPILSKIRTLGISKSNIEFFRKNIIDIKKIIWKLKKVEIFTDNLKNEKLLNFEDNDDQLFSIVKNFKLCKILENSLNRISILEKL